MNQLDKKDNADLDKIDRDINFHRIMVFLILVTAIIFYMIFINLKVSEAAQSWGPVGDFFGGILNPIFALFAFYWLTYSVRLQIKELKETREELSKAAKAQEESAKHQQEIARIEAENVKTQGEILNLNKETLKSQQDAAIAQQEQIASKNYENLFFELLKLKNEALLNIKFNFETIEFPHLDFQVENEVKESSGIDGLFQYLSLYKKYYKGSWTEYYGKNMINYFEKYLKMCTLLLENIYNQDFEKSDIILNKNKYIDILKTTFSQWEFEILFYHYLEDSSSGIHEILECYSFFDLMKVDLVNNNSDVNSLVSCAFKYKKRAFGSSLLWGQYFSSIEKAQKINEDKYYDMLELMSEIDLVVFRDGNKVDFDRSLITPFRRYEINTLLNNFTVDKIFENESFDLIEWEGGLKINNKHLEVVKYLDLIYKYENLKKHINDNLRKSETKFNKNKKFKINSEGEIFEYSLNELESIISVYENNRKIVSDEFYDLISLKKKIFNSEDAYAALAILKYRISDKRFFQE